MTLVEPVFTDPFVLYQSTLLSAYAERVIHGFTGKPVTFGGPGYSPEEIRANRLALCKQAGLSAAELVVPRQTHTDQFRLNNLPCEDETDAVILTEPGIPALVQVADCVPIILYDPAKHLGAVIHAGWRGTAQTIARKVASSLIHNHGASPDTLIAVVGPSIGGCCYEVSPEVAEKVATTVPDAPTEAYQVMQPNGKPRVDLKQVNALQLGSLGISHIEQIPACTRCEDDKLWSFRRGENGRQVAFLELQP